jgi:hypothetical protein
MEHKPCDKCPWIEKGQPHIGDRHKQAAKDGQRFCCHKFMGTCFGALNVTNKYQRKLKLNDNGKTQNNSRD